MEILRNVLTFPIITINPSDASGKEGQGAACLPYVPGIFAPIGGIGAIISTFLVRPKT
jgi:hypothetical protein